MSQSLTQIYLHIVFSTKERRPFLQEEHHRRESFLDEFRRLLKIYEIEYDERYVWD